VYATGTTFLIDFPTKPGSQPAGLFASAFVTQFSPDGSWLGYFTYWGGNGADKAYALAVDSSVDAYVTGLTTSPNSSITAGAYQTICAPIPNQTGEFSASSYCNSSDYYLSPS
jgi:hypothetical protein